MSIEINRFKQNSPSRPIIYTGRDKQRPPQIEGIKVVPVGQVGQSGTNVPPNMPVTVAQQPPIPAQQPLAVNKKPAAVAQPKTKTSLDYVEPVNNAPQDRPVDSRAVSSSPVVTINFDALRAKILQGKSLLKVARQKVPFKAALPALLVAKNFASKNALSLGALAIGVIVGGIGYGMFASGNSGTAPVASLFSAKKGSSSIAAGGSASKMQVSGTQSMPSFKPLVPKGKPQLADPTKSGATYNNNQDSYSFNDLFAGTPIVVGEQPIPKEYGTSEEAIKAIAVKLNATEAFQSLSGLGYIATDPETKAQTVISSKKNTLIIITSQYGHSLPAWGDYLNSLE